MAEDSSVDALQRTLAPHHEQMAKISAEITRLQQQRATVKLAASAALSQIAALKGTADLIPSVVARCW